jgi:hypothetical protein
MIYEVDDLGKECVLPVKSVLTAGKNGEFMGNFTLKTQSIVQYPDDNRKKKQI